MKIQAIQNYKYNNFTGATVPHYRINHSYNTENEQDPHNSIPEWVRKGMLAILVIFAVKNDPAVQNLTKSQDETREEKIRTEFLEQVKNLGKGNELAPAMYHLNRLVDVDNIGISPKGRESYTLNINFDKEKLSTTITLSPLSNNYIAGTFKSESGETIRYKAIFSNNNPDIFKVQIRNPNQDEYTFGRTSKGELYRLDGNKKVILNKKNVEEYQKIIENIPDFETLQNFEFFTDKNDMWRKLNLIILTLLLINEIKHDNAKRKKQN